MAEGTPITVRKQWLTILVFSLLAMIAELLYCALEPEEFARGRHGVFSVAAGLLWWLGHAVWLSMDRNRRGLESGGWRYAVIILGPVAIWIYLIVEYRARALYLIPLSLGIYGILAIVLLGALTVFCDA